MSENKKISPQAIVALEKALTAIYWYKRDLKRFLYQIIGEGTGILAVIDWTDLKKNIAARVIDMLVKNGARTHDILMQLIFSVSDFSDFSHLEILDGGKEKAKTAMEAVKALRTHVCGHQHIQKELEEAKQRREKAQAHQNQLNRAKQILSELKNEFYSWSISSDRQGSGFALEKILYRLFELSDLDPKGSFKVTGEQIDGAFSFNYEEYLLEAKWRNKQTPLSDLDSFSGKIGRKFENTLGLFISISGFSEEAIIQFKISQDKRVLLMDGEDLIAVLDERITLSDLLARKRREAAQTGNIYLKYRDMIK